MKAETLDDIHANSGINAGTRLKHHSRSAAHRRPAKTPGHVDTEQDVSLVLGKHTIRISERWKISKS